MIKIMAPGFTGETDLIKSVSPFGTGKRRGKPTSTARANCRVITSRIWSISRPYLAGT